jgi:hypothetical protein
VRVHAIIQGVGRWMTREVQAQSGYNSQVVDLHLGLGDATVADSVVVRWPSGAVESLPGVQADDRRTIVEGVGVVAVPGRAEAFRLSVVPQGGRFAIRYALPHAGRATLKLYDVRGRLVRTIADGDSEAGTHSAWLDRAALPASGLYFLRLSTGDNAAVAKVLNVR